MEIRVNDIPSFDIAILNQIGNKSVLKSCNQCILNLFVKYRVCHLDFRECCHKNKLDFLNKILMTDEAHFTLSDGINKQNCLIWRTENPRNTTAWSNNHCLGWNVLKNSIFSKLEKLSMAYASVGVGASAMTLLFPEKCIIVVEN